MQNKRYQTTSLLPFQQRSLQTLALCTDIVIISCNSNIGVALINTSHFINYVFSDHMSNKEIYKELAEDEVIKYM